MSILADENHPLPSAVAEVPRPSPSTTGGSTAAQARDQRVIRVQSMDEFTAEMEGSPLTAAGTASPRRQILVCVDEADGGVSAEAVQWACDQVVRDGDILTLLHIVDSGDLTDLFYEDQITPEDASRVRDSIVAEALRTTEKFVTDAIEKRLDCRRGISVFVEVKIGDAREVIVETAKENNATCVVMGSRGRNALARLLLGSVSEYVVHQCPMPVIVVRPGANSSSAVEAQKVAVSAVAEMIEEATSPLVGAMAVDAA